VRRGDAFWLRLGRRQGHAVQFVAQAVLAIATVGVAVAQAIRHDRQLAVAYTTPPCSSRPELGSPVVARHRPILGLRGTLGDVDAVDQLTAPVGTPVVALTMPADPPA
jgi:hypothetical protein